MNTSKEPTLFDRLQPRSMEVSNGDLIGVLKSLKLRGAHVSGMTSKPDNSGWRLIIEWPVMVARPMPGPVRSFPFDANKNRADQSLPVWTG